MFSVPETIEDAISMKRLWIHEILRVYYDRLVDDEDRSWFFDNLHSISREFLNENLNDIFTHLTNGKTETVSLTFNLFGNNQFYLFLSTNRLVKTNFGS